MEKSGRQPSNVNIVRKALPPNNRVKIESTCMYVRMADKLYLNKQPLLAT